MSLYIVRGHNCTKDFSGLNATVIDYDHIAATGVLPRIALSVVASESVAMRIAANNDTPKTVICALWQAFPSLLRLRKRGEIDRLIFWLCDWYPINGGFVRRIIHATFQCYSRYAMTVSDERWYASDKLMQSCGVDGEIVPSGHGCWPEEWTDAEDNRMFVIASPLIRGMGIGTALVAMCQLPGYRLAIVGKGPELEYYRSLSERLGVSGRVRFTGFLDDATMRKLIARCCAGLALYPETSHASYGISAKANTYIGCGIPVVIANSGSADMLHQSGAGIRVLNTPDSVALAMLQISASSASYRASAKRRAYELIEERKIMLRRLNQYCQ